MKQNIIIVHTPTNGHKYAGYIAKEANLMGHETRLASVHTVNELILKRNWKPSNTLIHFRTAGPKATTPKAIELEKKGFRVINPSTILERTSDKFLSFQWAKDHGLSLPITHKGTEKEIRNMVSESGLKKFVLKPVNSQGQGAYCYQSFSDDSKLEKKIKQVPGEHIIVQEFVNYKGIYRVIVINGKALNKAVFYDSPTKDRWRVSVCLNPNIKLVKDPDNKLLDYALKTAKIFQTEIGFIDIFETDRGYMLSEINTACNLIQHERKSGYNISKDIANYLVSQL